MRRTTMLVTVVALMVVMLAMSVAPAFARPPLNDCEHPETGAFVPTIPSNVKHFFLKEGFECVKQ
jgi:methionine-rich copper-binding protein CopC